MKRRSIIEFVRDNWLWMLVLVVLAALVVAGPGDAFQCSISITSTANEGRGM